jgi:hypothetical protein
LFATLSSVRPSCQYIKCQKKTALKPLKNTTDNFVAGKKHVYFKGNPDVVIYILQLKVFKARIMVPLNLTSDKSWLIFATCLSA